MSKNRHISKFTKNSLVCSYGSLAQKESTNVNLKSFDGSGKSLGMALYSLVDAYKELNIVLYTQIEGLVDPLC